MSKCYMHICKCGKLHVMRLEYNERYIGICRNCGEVIGTVSRELALEKDRGTDVRVFKVPNTGEEFITIANSTGLDVPMMSGNTADSFQDGHFCDLSQGRDYGSVDVERIIKTWSPELVEDIKRNNYIRGALQLSKK